MEGNQKQLCKSRTRLKGVLLPFLQPPSPATSAYDDRLLVSRPVYSQETFDAAESTAGANLRERRTDSQRVSDQLVKSCRCDKEKVTSFILDQLPALRWLPKYDLRQNLMGDIMAGFTISVLHLPQVKEQFNHVRSNLY